MKLGEKGECKAFIDNLLTAVAPDGQIIVVLTLRADFYVQCFEFHNLRQAGANFQAHIGHMCQDELRRAIEEPARPGRWEFEPGMVDLVLRDDIGEEHGAQSLPPLSHALLRRGNDGSGAC